MPREESLQHWLDRNRPPRVQITYDVETLGAIEKKELPFVVGILADLWGKTAHAEAHGPLSKTFKKRSFTEIDRDTFGQFMKKTAPSAKLQIEDRLSETAEGAEPKKIPVGLTFESIDDFRPEAVISQIRDTEGSADLKPLQDLLKARQELAELLARADVKDQINDELNNVVQATGGGGGPDAPAS